MTDEMYIAALQHVVIALLSLPGVTGPEYDRPPKDDSDAMRHAIRQIARAITYLPEGVKERM